MTSILHQGASDSWARDIVEMRATSRDGTSIGFLRFGSGPGLLLVQGAMGSVANYRRIAQLLARNFTVHLRDRRGRGMSRRPYSAAHDIGRDVEDLEAVSDASNVRFVFGLSSGAMIALEAAKRLPTLERAAVYEPPFYPKGIDRAGVAHFNEEVECGDLSSALVTAGRIVGLAPPPIRVLPRTIARHLAGAVLRRDAAQSAGSYLRLAELIPAMRYDFNVVAGLQGAMRGFADLVKPVQVVSGTRSPRYLQIAAAKLTRILPDGRHAILRALNHSGPWNEDKGGQPGRVANILRDHFV